MCHNNNIKTNLETQAKSKLWGECNFVLSHGSKKTNDVVVKGKKYNVYIV